MLYLSSDLVSSCILSSPITLISTSKPTPTTTSRFHPRLISISILDSLPFKMQLSTTKHYPITSANSTCCTIETTSICISKHLDMLMISIRLSLISSWLIFAMELVLPMARHKYLPLASCQIFTRTVHILSSQTWQSKHSSSPTHHPLPTIIFSVMIYSPKHIERWPNFW